MIRAPMRRSNTINTQLRRYMVVVEMPAQSPDATHTARVERSKEATAEARASLARWLETEGFSGNEYELEPPAAFGTFGLVSTERVAKALRGAPGVQAVLEATA